MKKIVREYDLDSEQLNRVRKLARSLNLNEITAKILFARGIDTEEKMKAFLNPSAKHFLSPTLMKGMNEAVELIAVAKEEEWRVAVFGDYDADGIGASAILYRALCEYGIEPYLYVPERSEGYGMSLSAIDKIFDEYLPDLFITVDCGISNRREVEYIKEQGAYVIVTDHHELPGELPDCICINPKIADDYPYDNLCGAGVALKLAQALIGDRANRLLDFAALSTVADSVPLVGENRDIVAEGLKLIERDPRPAFAALLGKNAESITAQTLAFTVAPRINAAGRMGDAHAALRLFTTDDENEIFDLAAKLNAYNTERQKCCDEVYAQASAQIKQKGAYGSVIMLAGEEWNTGFVGIVAARLTEEYGRPTLLFVKKGDMLKGSARSVESVNIYEALRACSEYIEEFGGHAQAAGINLKEENFEALENALNAVIQERYRAEDFIPKIYVTEEIEEAIPLKLAKELNRLEPYGVGNRRPMFLLSANKMQASPVKPLSPHVTASVGGMDLIYFGGSGYLPILESDIGKKIVFECNLSKFRGREYLKGYIRTVLYDGMSGTCLAAETLENALRSLRSERTCGRISLTLAQTEALIAEKLGSCQYGLCMVASDRRSVGRYAALADYPKDAVDIFSPSAGNVANLVLLDPLPDTDLSAYREIVFLDRPAAVCVETGRAKVYVCEELCGYKPFYAVSTLREDLLAVFAALRTQPIYGNTYAEALRSCGGLGFAPEQFLFALAVFDDLGLVSFDGGRLRIERGKKTDLNDSIVYTSVKALTEE